MGIPSFTKDKYRLPSIPITKDMMDIGLLSDAGQEALRRAAESMRLYMDSMLARSTSRKIGRSDLGIHSDYYDDDLYENSSMMDSLIDGEEEMEMRFGDEKLDSLNPSNGPEYYMDITKCHPHLLFTNDKLSPLCQDSSKPSFIERFYHRNPKLDELKPDDNASRTVGNLRMTIMKERMNPLY